jgi:hypothetical protein
VTGGGSGATEDRRRMLIRVIAAQVSVQVTVRESTGVKCVLCLTAIAIGSRQYEIPVGQSPVIVDENCYNASLRDIVEASPIIGDEASPVA